jgi:hypothetical protein
LVVVFAILTVRATSVAGASVASTIIVWSTLAVIAFGVGDAFVFASRVRKATGVAGFALRWALGYVVFAFVNLVATSFLPPAVVYWAIFSASGLWLAGRAYRLRGSWASVDFEGFLSGAALTALLASIAASGSKLLVAVVGSNGTKLRLAQYWDMLYHVAVTKEGLLHGVPWTQEPLLAGTGWPSYHAAFNAVAVSLSAATGVTAEHAVTAFAVPATFVVAAMAVSALVGSWFDGDEAPLSAAVVVLAPMLAAALPAVLARSRFDIRQMAYFLYNPPAALGAACILAGLALIARADNDRPTAQVVLGAAVVTASTVMKVNFAVAFVPAVAISLSVMAAMRKLPWRTWLAAMATMGATGLLGLWLLRGVSTGTEVRYGMFAEWLRHRWPATPILAAVSRPFSASAVLGPPYLVAVYLLIVVLGVRLAIAVAAGVSGRESRRAWREWLGRHQASAIAIVAAFVMTVVVGLTLVQKDAGRYEAFNIAAHTLHGFYWIGVALAGASVGLLVRRLGAKRDPLVLAAAMLVVIALLAVPARTGMRAIRQTGADVVPSDFVAVLSDAQRLTPVDSLVVQHLDIERNAWVAGIAGRRTPLERADQWVAYEPQVAVPRKRLIEALYSANDRASALMLARRLGAKYIVVSTRDPKALWVSGKAVSKHGDWALIEFPY